MKIYRQLYGQIISVENLFLSWEKFSKGKRGKPDVAFFERHLEENIFALHRELKAKIYQHGSYTNFYIRDPKVRYISKASVRDRIVHHALFRVLSTIFEPTFIATSFSCQIGKGNHEGVEVLAQLARKVSQNYTKPCFALKCDIKKFFDSVDHQILLSIMTKRVRDVATMDLVRDIVGSYYVSQTDLFHRQGIPIGNLTSQLFANIYMNEFDQFIKHQLKVQHYLRYTDDFIILSDSKDEFDTLLLQVKMFLQEKLHLSLHKHKVNVRTLHQGIDFLGYVVKPHYRILRTKTRKRLIRCMNARIEAYQSGRLGEEKVFQSLHSYQGMMCHAHEYRFTKNLKNKVWFRLPPVFYNSYFY
ncbi:group II intron reverse transcriptase domain-containing protein [Patescibacteria group bacterium]|nr:group II intron reverse transcriptase domain-containing protein [Patescibacteria group bacterium]